MSKTQAALPPPAPPRAQESQFSPGDIVRMIESRHFGDFVVLSNITEVGFGSAVHLVKLAQCTRADNGTIEQHTFIVSPVTLERANVADQCAGQPMTAAVPCGGRLKLFDPTAPIEEARGLRRAARAGLFSKFAPAGGGIKKKASKTKKPAKKKASKK